MSGRKRATVSLSEADRKRLQEAQQRFRRMENDFNAIRQRIEQSSQPDLMHSLQEVQERQAQFADSIGGLSDHLREIEQRTSDQLVERTRMILEHNQDAIQRQSQQLQAAQYQAVAQMESNVLDQTASLIDDYSFRMMSVIEENSFAQQSEFQRINTYLSNQSKNTKRRQRIAYSVLESATTLFNSLRGIYGAEPSRAEYFQDMEQALNTAWNNLQSGFFDAAVVVGQESYLSLSKARVEIENMIQTRSLVYNHAWNKLQIVAACVNENKSIHAMDLDGNLLSIQLNPDDWTDGRLTSLEQYALDAIHNLQAPIQTLSIEGLQAYAQYADDLQVSIVEVIREARLAAISSQVRFNIAEIVLGALGEQGFQLVNSAYERGDMCASYQMSLADPGGSELEIQIMPIKGEVIAHDLEMVTLHPEQHTEHELRQRGRELAGSLKAVGLQLGRIDGAPIGDLVVRETPASNAFTQLPGEEVKRLKR